MHNILLDVKNVKKRYAGAEGRLALKGVSFELYKGEVFGLLGANGAGKTTLSSIIATLHPATEGEILWRGKSIYDDLMNYRTHLGFCPQQPNLDNNLSLEDNLRFAGRFYKMSERDINLRLQELSDQFGLTTYLKEKPDVLSGGYRQRFMIARSIIHNPSLLLLDEPTVGLDPHIRRQLWQVIKDLRDAGVTIILTTHYLDEAEYLSDRVCILHDGLVKLIDKPANLKSDFKKANLEEVFLTLISDEN